MYAVIREVSVRPEAQEQMRAAGEEFSALRAQQPGFRGSMRIDAGDGRMVVVTLWEDEQAVEAARPVLQAEAERLLHPHLSAPIRFVYRGPVVADDLTAR
jgi:heme-degrading monooxygenase HmoA